VIYVIIFFVKIAKIISEIVMYVCKIFAKTVVQNVFVEMYIVILVLLYAKNAEEEYVIIALENVFAILLFFVMNV
jgi:hypothetical protein